LTKNFDFLGFLGSIIKKKKNIYITEGELLNFILLNNLDYYKNYYMRLNKLFDDTYLSLEPLCFSIYKESDELVIRLENMLKLLSKIVTEKSYDKGEKVFLSELKKVSEEFSNFKFIFFNFNEILKNIISFCDGFNKSIRSFNRLSEASKSGVLLFNKEEFLGFIINNDIDLQPLKNSSDIMLEVVDGHNKLANKLSLCEELLERRYVVVDNFYFDSEMRKYDNIINNNSKYYKLKKQFKLGT
jgi:hypothetical protein